MFKRFAASLDFENLNGISLKAEQASIELNKPRKALNSNFFRLCEAQSASAYFVAGWLEPSLSYSWIPRMRQMDMASDAAATHSCEGLVQEKSLLFLAESRSELTLQKASCQGGSVVC